MSVTYLAPEDVTAARVTKTPAYGRSADGYGRKIPTEYLVRTRQDSRWRRVYVCCYSNSGTAYIETKGCKFLVVSRAEDRIRQLVTEGAT
jgi:hypothetical protein